MSEKESLKLAKFRKRGYIRVGYVKSLTHYFSVSKGEDTRMLYSETYSSINASLWDNHVALPIVVSTLHAVEKGTLM